MRHLLMVSEHLLTSYKELETRFNKYIEKQHDKEKSSNWDSAKKKASFQRRESVMMSMPQSPNQSMQVQEKFQMLETENLELMAELEEARNDFEDLER